MSNWFERGKALRQEEYGSSSRLGRVTKWFTLALAAGGVAAIVSPFDSSTRSGYGIDAFEATLSALQTGGAVLLSGLVIEGVTTAAVYLGVRRNKFLAETLADFSEWFNTTLVGPEKEAELVARARAGEDVQHVDRGLVPLALSVGAGAGMAAGVKRKADGSVDYRAMLKTGLFLILASAAIFGAIGVLAGATLKMSLGLMSRTPGYIVLGLLGAGGVGAFLYQVKNKTVDKTKVLAFAGVAAVLSIYGNTFNADQVWSHIATFCKSWLPHWGFWTGLLVAEKFEWATGIYQARKGQARDPQPAISKAKAEYQQELLDNTSVAEVAARNKVVEVGPEVRFGQPAVLVDPSTGENVTMTLRQQVVLDPGSAKYYAKAAPTPQTGQSVDADIDLTADSSRRLERGSGPSH